MGSEMCIRDSINIVFSRCRLIGVIQARGLPNRNNLQYFPRPGSSYRCHPPNTFHSGRAQPPKRERLGFPANPRARRTRRQKGADCVPQTEEHPRLAREVSCPGAINLAEIRDLVPGSSVDNTSFRSLSALGDKSIYTKALRGGPLWRPAASLVGCMRCQVL